MKRLRMMIAFVMFLLLGLSSQALAQLAVSSSSTDFGDVKVGTAANQIVRAVNPGYDWIWLDAEISGSTDFGISSNFPVLISPGGYVDIEVLFTPSAEGPSKASLLINDVIYTILIGEGVAAQP